MGDLIWILDLNSLSWGENVGELIWILWNPKYGLRTSAWFTNYYMLRFVTVVGFEILVTLYYVSLAVKKITITGIFFFFFTKPPIIFLKTPNFLQSPATSNFFTLPLLSDSEPNPRVNAHTQPPPEDAGRIVTPIFDHLQPPSANRRVFFEQLQPINPLFFD